MRRWIYIPDSKEYAIPWLAAPFLGFVLTIFDVPKGKAPALPSIAATILAYALTAGALLVLNALLFWVNLRTQFLTWTTARRQFVGTYLALTAFYLGSYAVILWIVRKAEPSLVSIDWPFTFQCLVLALLTMMAAFGMSGVWKAEEPGFSNLRLQRRRLRQLLSQLLSEPVVISADEYRTLIAVLAQLIASVATAMGQAIDADDIVVMSQWRARCTELYAEMKDTYLADFNSSQRLPALAAAARTALAKESPDA